MGKKWQRIDPAELKVGDRVKVKHDCGDYRETTFANVVHRSDVEIGVGPYCFYPNQGTWYIRKPKKKPLTRPDEPPVGTFFRVDRTGRNYLRLNDDGYTYATGDTTYAWQDITEPGDTITLLDLVERES